MTSFRPKVSIIVPVFNAEKYLYEALRSCLIQTYYPIEIICIENNSTDQSLAILEGYQKEFPEIIKVVKENRPGAPYARNTGIENATGQYIHFLDADDVLLSNAVEILVSCMEEDIDAVCGSENYYRNDMVNGYDGERVRITNMDYQLNDILTNHPNTGAVLIKKSSIKEVKWDITLSSHQELVFWAELCLKNNARFKYIPQKVCKIRIHDSPYRISNQEKGKKAYQKYLAILKIESLLEISPYKTAMMRITFNDFKLQHAFDSIHARNFLVSKLISSKVDKTLIPFSKKFRNWSKEGITYFTNHYLGFAYYYLGRKLFGKN